MFGVVFLFPEEFEMLTCGCIHSKKGLKKITWSTSKGLVGNNILVIALEPGTIYQDFPLNILMFDFQRLNFCTRLAELQN